MGLYNPAMLSLVLAFVAFVTFQADPAAHAHALLAAIAAKDFATIEAQYTDAMKAAMPPGRLEAAWTAIQLQAGSYKRCAAESRVRAIADKQMAITTCEFERASIDVQFAFDTGGRLAGLVFRPAAAPSAPYTLPPYATASAFTSRDVTVGSGEWALPATLTVPNGDGAFPAVVLVHGSGPNDRDETLGPNKPFADLAAGLASRGIAVLRYDKRSRVYGAKMAALPSITVKDEVVDDALAAVTVLRTQPKIDAARVFVLGHSFGGTLVPRIAAADPKLAGVIVMAGAVRPIPQELARQIKYLAEADGTVTPQEQAQIDAAVTQAQAVDALTPQDAAAGKHLLNAPASYWLDLRGYDPPAAAKALAVPMLILQGERDYQVTMDEFAQWKAALAGRATVTFHSYPALNHLFMPGTGKSLPTEYEQASHVAAQVVEDIAAWIKR